MTNTKRVFVGIELSSTVKKRLETVVKGLLKKHWKVWWEPADKWHVTLVFLGEVEEEKVQLLGKELARELAEFRSFELRLKGLGQFPQPESVRVRSERISGRMVHEVTLPRRKSVLLPKVVFVSLRGELKALHQLQDRVLSVCRQAGIEVGQQGAFVPHITLGRVQDNAKVKELRVMAGEIEKQYDRFSEVEFTIKGVAVFESVLSQEGSQYHIVKEVPFGKGDADAD